MLNSSSSSSMFSTAIAGSLVSEYQEKGPGAGTITDSSASVVVPQIGHLCSAPDDRAWTLS